MIESSVIVELQKKYESGERDFSKIELRRANLQGINLSRADLRGADFSYANLRKANLSGANLSEAYFNEADLTGANLQGANLQGAFLIKAYLIKMNLKEVNLSQAYLTGSYLTKSDLSQANLSGAYLNGSKITGTILVGAYYDKKTHFDIAFDAPKNGLKEIFLNATPIIQEPKITVEELINAFNYLSQISVHYLGHTMTTRYWETSRLNDEWLTEFQFNRFAKISFSGEQQLDLDPTQIQKAQEWFNLFIKSCSKIIQDFPRMIDLQQITFPLSSLEVYQEKKIVLGKLQPNKQLLNQTISEKTSTRVEVLNLNGLPITT